MTTTLLLIAIYLCLGGLMSFGVQKFAGKDFNALHLVACLTVGPLFLVGAMLAGFYKWVR